METIAKTEVIISRIEKLKKEYHRNGICFMTGTPYKKVSLFDNYPEDLKPPNNGTEKRCSICGYILERD